MLGTTRAQHVRRPAAAGRVALSLSALAALAAPASACPSCGLTGDMDTLIFILAFLAIPYVVVSATLAWIRRILKGDTPPAGSAAGRESAHLGAE